MLSDILSVFVQMANDEQHGRDEGVGLSLALVYPLCEYFDALRVSLTSVGMFNIRNRAGYLYRRTGNPWNHDRFNV